MSRKSGKREVSPEQRMAILEKEVADMKERLFLTPGMAVLTPAQAGKILQVAPATIIALIRSGQLRGCRLSTSAEKITEDGSERRGIWRTTTGDVYELLKTAYKPISQETEEELL